MVDYLLTYMKEKEGKRGKQHRRQEEAEQHQGPAWGGRERGGGEGKTVRQKPHSSAPRGAPAALEAEPPLAASIAASSATCSSSTTAAAPSAAAAAACLLKK